MFLKTLATAATALALGAPLAFAEELKLADFQPPTHFVVEQVYNPFAEAVAAGTNGEVTIKRLSLGQRGVRLLPRNPAYAPIEVAEGQDFAIEGIYCGLVRRG